MLIKTRAIVFRSIKYADSSLICDLYTEAEGLHSFILSGVRTARSRFSAGLLQPMSVIEIVAYFRKNAELNRVKEMQAGLVFRAIPFELRRGSVALFMAEICRKTVRESEANGPVFQFLEKTVAHLDTTADPISTIHLHFLVELAGFLGFRPGGEATAATPFFDLQEGIFMEMKPAHPFFLFEEESRLLQKLMETPLERCHEIQLSRPLRKSMLSHLLKFYQLHLDHFGEIHTPEILEMVMEGG